MKKKVCVLLSICLVFLVCASFAQAGSKLKLLVNGVEVESDVPVQIIKNRTLVPVRALAEALGATVAWDEEQGIVSVNNEAGARRLAKLEEALAPMTSLEAVELWAQGVKTRNGALEYALFSAELREKTYQDYASSGWQTGTSSPWVEEFIIEKIAGTAGQDVYQVEFQLATSTGAAGIEMYKVTVSRTGEKWVITKKEPWLEEERGDEVPYQIRAYPELPAQVQAFVDRAKYHKTTRVIKGEGKRQYLFLSLGARNTGGYGIEISRVEEVAGKIVVTYRERRPAPAQIVIQVITYPWQVIQIDSPLPLVVQEE